MHIKSNNTIQHTSKITIYLKYAIKPCCGKTKKKWNETNIVSIRYSLNNPYLKRNKYTNNINIFQLHATHKNSTTATCSVLLCSRSVLARSPLLQHTTLHTNVHTHIQTYIKLFFYFSCEIFFHDFLHSASLNMWLMTTACLPDVWSR